MGERCQKLFSCQTLYHKSRELVAVIEIRTTYELAGVADMTNSTTLRDIAACSAYGGPNVSNSGSTHSPIEV
jgi:hypothetical protein